MRARLDAGSWERLHCLLIVMLSSGAACVVSFALLTLHLHSMAWRYGLASLAGYGAFLLLIRGWVRWKWSRLVPDSGVDLSDLVGSGDLPLPGRAGNVATNLDPSIYASVASTSPFLTSWLKSARSDWTEPDTWLPTWTVVTAWRVPVADMTLTMLPRVAASVVRVGVMSVRRES
jgi:hypothetical protein